MPPTGGSGADLVVIGGGVGGLAAALLSARRGASVVLVERDGDPVEGPPDADFTSWRRPGVPQAQHSHAFLGLGTRVLGEEAPDVIAALRSRGVPEVAASWRGRGRVDGAVNLLSRRLVFEAVLRRTVMAEPGVRMLVGDRVTGLVATPGRPPVVRGVRTAQSGEIGASLVAVATGRRSPITEWAAELGVSELPVTLHRLGLQYYTRFYRLHDGMEYPSLERPQSARLSYLLAMAFPSDNRTFSLTVSCFVDDPFRRALADPLVFERVLSAVPLTRPWVEAGAPISPLYAMARIDNRWQRLVEDNHTPLLGGIVLVGDSSMHTNPTFGRGMSLAFEQAQRLASTLGASSDPVGYTAEFERWIADHHREWFDVQVATDDRIVARFRAALRGEEATDQAGPGGQLTLAMFAAADTDDVVAEATTRFFNMLARPSEIFSNSDLRERLDRYAASHNLSVTDSEGPTRAEFEAMVAAI